MSGENQLTLYESEDSFVVEHNTSGKCIGIDREEGSVVDGVEKKGFKFLPTQGVIGTIQLFSGSFLAVVQQSSLIGNLHGKDIFRLEKADLIPLARNRSTVSEDLKREEDRYRGMLLSVLNSKSFYFSHELDLSHVYAKQLGKTRPEESNEKFVWNLNWLDTFKALPASSMFTVSLIRGFMEIREFDVNEHHVKYALVSRQSRHRPGTRYFVRGIDEDGHVANFVETEQIVIANGRTADFVQTRGSIPLFWEQKPNLKYKPKVKFTSPSSEVEDKSFRLHMDQMIREYGTTTVVNLVDNKGGEGELARKFEEKCDKFGETSLKYVYFDFHHECRKMRYDLLSLLVEKVEQDFLRQGYYMHRDNDQVCSKIQKGVFRSNCMDCLDRTNVVESVFARHVLVRQLREMGVFGQVDDISKFPEFEKIFKNVWADNADIISLMYSGTGALKTDYTRTGKRSFAGLLNDGVNSMQRYYLNNFQDGKKQDSLDLFVGNYVVPPAGDQKPKVTKSDNPQIWPVVLLAIGIFMIFVNILFSPLGYGWKLAGSGLWMLGSSLLIMHALKHGTDYVDSPKLAQAKKIV